MKNGNQNPEKKPRNNKNRRRAKSELDRALTAAINKLPGNSVIKPILMSYRDEVFAMCLTEYTQEHADKVRKIEARKRERDAEKRGIKIGELKALYKLVLKGKLTIQEAAEESGMTVEEFKAEISKA